MISPKEVAEKFGIDLSLVYRLIYTQRLKAMKRKNRWWIEESELFKICPERSVIVGELLGAIKYLDGLKKALEGVLNVQLRQELLLRKIYKNGDEINEHSNIRENGGSRDQGKKGT